MSLWWYVHKDKKTGPVAVDELRQLLQTGAISLKTLVWQEGLEAWRPLDEVEALSALKGTLPPPLPPKVAADPLALPSASRWTRFGARLFDIWWETLSFSYLTGYILGRYSAGFVEWINSPGSDKLFGMACIPFAFILDAVIYKLFGNTPGKALLGVKVTTFRGEPLSLVQYLGRNLGVWISGLALGFPVISLITLAVQSHRLGKGQPASYDEGSKSQVRSAPVGFLRKGVFLLALLGLFGALVWLGVAEKEASVSVAPVGKPYFWENPLTHRFAMIDPKWTHSTKLNDDGQEYYQFTEFTNHAIVNLAAERGAGLTLDDYVRAFQKNNGTRMHFPSGGRFFEAQGYQTLEVGGSLASDTSLRVNVQVVQIGSAFWRVVVLQSLPYDYSDSLVRQLQTSLWATVKGTAG